MSLLCSERSTLGKAAHLSESSARASVRAFRRIDEAHTVLPVGVHFQCQLCLSALLSCLPSLGYPLGTIHCHRGHHSQLTRATQPRPLLLTLSATMTPIAASSVRLLAASVMFSTCH